MTGRFPTGSLFCAISLLILLPGGYLFASPSPQDRPYYLVERLSRDVFVNWSNGTIYAHVTVPVRKAEKASLTEARLTAIREAREQARASLTRGILTLPVDGEGTWEDHMRKDSRLRQDFESIERDFHLLENTTGEGTVSLRLGMPLYGRTGLFRRLSRPDAESESPFADLKLPVPAERFTGVIVFTELVSGFHASLRPALSLNTGDRFLVVENRADSRGLFFPDQNSAKTYGRVGDRPLVLFAPSALNQTDLVIDSSDAKRILGNARLYKAAREGRIAFVVARSTASSQHP